LKQKIWTFVRVLLPIALMKYLPTCFSIPTFIRSSCTKKQGTKQYVYKLLKSHKLLNTLKYYYINTVEW